MLLTTKKEHDMVTAHGHYVGMSAEERKEADARLSADLPKGAFRAILTGTTNEYLAARVPVSGYVQIIEINRLGAVSSALFMPDVPEGELTSFVRVPDARFQFGTWL
jgi:hypothetical protein